MPIFVIAPLLESIVAVIPRMAATDGLVTTETPSVQATVAPDVRRETPQWFEGGHVESSHDALDYV